MGTCCGTRTPPPLELRRAGGAAYGTEVIHRLSGDLEVVSSGSTKC